MSWKYFSPPQTFDCQKLSVFRLASEEYLLSQRVAVNGWTEGT